VVVRQVCASATVSCEGSERWVAAEVGQAVVHEVAEHENC